MENAPQSAAGAPIVIGAGMAGVAAAVTLAECGMRPLLIESRPYIGGRARSFIHQRKGGEIDNGPHLLFGCYTPTPRPLTTLRPQKLVRLEPPPRREVPGR